LLFIEILLKSYFIELKILFIAYSLSLWRGLGRGQKL